MIVAGMLPLNSTVDFTDPCDFVTVAVTVLRLKPVLPAICALKILSASVTPAGIGPSVDMAAAAVMRGTILRPSRRSRRRRRRRSWLRMLLARL